MVRRAETGEAPDDEDDMPAFAAAHSAYLKELAIADAYVRSVLAEHDPAYQLLAPTKIAAARACLQMQLLGIYLERQRELLDNNALSEDDLCCLVDRTLIRVRKADDHLVSFFDTTRASAGVLGENLETLAGHAADYDGSKQLVVDELGASLVAEGVSHATHVSEALETLSTATSIFMDQISTFFTGIAASEQLYVEAVRREYGTVDDTLPW